MRPLDAILEDWDTIKKRYTHWWANELYDRALVQVTQPKEGVQRGEWPGGAVTPESRWLNIEYMIWRMEETIRTTYYGGETLPNFFHAWAVGHALLMGCEPRIGDGTGTVWVDPLPAAADGYPPIRFLREGHWWQWMRDSTLRAAQASRGRYWVMPMWGNNAGDTLAMVRGNNELMMDIAEDPTWVRQAARQVSDILIEVYATLWPLVGERVTGIEGSINYCNTWSPGRTMGFDCDLSCMISPRQFEDLFLPPLIETMRTVDHRFYHLDGAVALHHLGLLLSVPEIQAIQWVPGTGREEILQWVPVIRRIQQAGKSVYVYAEAKEIPALLGEVSARGLCIATRCASEQEA
ncbi:MAG: hypothetical protein FJ280_30040, partial [Planctomycetes bacterium]|nr:hypothetical protein [Planctomycetota bacterium]